MTTDLIAYALTKQVPCIESQACFDTAYGALVLEGRDAQRVAALVAKLLEQKLRRAARQDRHSGDTTQRAA